MTVGTSSRIFRWTRVRIAWLLLAGLYGAFWLWYGGIKGPLTEGEAEDFVTRLIDYPHDTYDGPFVQRIRRFAMADDGNEIVVVRLIKARGGGEASLSASGSGDDIPLLAHAAHRVLVADVAKNVVQFVDAKDWSRVEIVRYRSRRDLLESMASPESFDNARQDVQNFERTMHIAAVPARRSFTGPRTVLFLFLVSLGLLIQLGAAARRSKTQSPPPTP